MNEKRNLLHFLTFQIRQRKPKQRERKVVFFLGNFLPIISWFAIPGPIYNYIYIYYHKAIQFGDPVRNYFWMFFHNIEICETVIENLVTYSGFDVSTYSFDT